MLGTNYLHVTRRTAGIYDTINTTTTTCVIRCCCCCCCCLSSRCMRRNTPEEDGMLERARKTTQKNLKQGEKAKYGPSFSTKDLPAWGPRLSNVYGSNDSTPYPTDYDGREDDHRLEQKSSCLVRGLLSRVCIYVVWLWLASNLNNSRIPRT